MKYRASKDLIELLIKKTSGFLSPKDFDNLINSIETEAKKYNFTKSSEANLIRIIIAVFDPISFLIDFTKYPHHAEVVMAIVSNSNYLTDIVVRNPEFLYLLFDNSFLSKKITRKNLSKEIKARFAKYSSFSSKLNFLRLLKRKTTLKIGLNDILGNDSFEDTVEQISAVANEIINQLFILCYSETLKKYNITSTKRTYCLCSLGKLGGNELNYSSDVDLVIFYDKSSKVGSKRNKEYFEILTEATHEFIKHGSDISSAGFLYRIDFRLRPDGKNAPLCRTLNDYLRYYESRGEDWERQMLIKLNLVSGSNSLFEQFQSYIGSFIYPSSFSTSPLAQIKKMKNNIEKRIAGNNNIKLFSGGIRDIEFAVQALQMVNGGKLKKVRTGTSLVAIPLLKDSGLLTAKETSILTEAYIFYRRIEHYLQLMNDAQTHDIPADEDNRLKIAKYVDVENSKELIKKIEQYRKKVRKIFNSIVSSDESEIPQNSLGEINFKNLSRAVKNRKYLKTGEGLINQKEFDSATIKLYGNIDSFLLEYLADCIDPDKVLENFATVIRSTGFPSIWFREFHDPTLFKDFLNVCLYSQRAIELLLHKKSLSEIFITRQFNVKDLSPLLPTMNIEGILFILSVQFALKLIDHRTVSKYLFEYISIKIGKCADSIEIPTKYFIAAFGSFGVKELGFTSDLDIVFVVEKIEDNELIQKSFQTMLGIIQKELKVFEIDCRLRPEGKKSPLVWEAAKYVEYLKNRARVWEYQAMLKINRVHGDKKLFKSFVTKSVNVIAQTSEINIKNEVTSMLTSVHKSGVSFGIPRQNIKKSVGALTDIDFTLAYISLTNKKYLKNNIGNGTLVNIEYLANSEPKLKSIAEFSEHYSFLKNISFAMKNIVFSNSSVIPKEEEKLLLLAKYFGYKDSNQLIKKITSTFNSVSELSKKFLK